MFNLEAIIENYPPHLRDKSKSILREYLQCKILEIVYNSKIAPKLSFIGGTAIRIIYNSPRFSEDIDFDNFDLSDDEFYSEANFVLEQLKLLGYEVTLEASKNKTIFHYKIKFPGLFYDLNLSSHKNEVIMIKFDSEKQGFDYQSEPYLLQRFGILSNILTPPKDILFSMKLHAFFDREMGRDLIDIYHMINITKPNYRFLEQKLGITNGTELKEKILSRFESFKTEKLIERTRNFVFEENNLKAITLFKEVIQASSL